MRHTNRLMIACIAASSLACMAADGALAAASSADTEPDTGPVDAVEPRELTPMRAKVRVGAVLPYQVDGVTTSERVVLSGVSRSTAYPDDGSDEDNTFARFSPSVNIDIQIANPALIGKYEVGDTFYLDFKPVEPKAD